MASVGRPALIAIAHWAFLRQIHLAEERKAVRFRGNIVFPLHARLNRNKRLEPRAASPDFAICRTGAEIDMPRLSGRCGFVRSKGISIGEIT